MGSVYSVGQVNTYIKNMFMQDYALNGISIKGEVSNCKYHSSGHIYFTLKDASGVLAGVMFAGNRRNGLKFHMSEGQNVIASGSVSVYERDGKYQLYAKEIVLDGTGQLYEKYEQLKARLEETGMFDSIYKKSIPKYAMNIGIVTASTGAAVQDIINISYRRNPYVSLYLYPAQVQGDGAAQSIVNGIRCLDEKGLDIIIVGRGGGSIEDLWAFNEEIVARAVFECNTPVISGVGHETDTTIVDYVADMRAPTPSAAAELAVFSYNDFSGNLHNIKFTLNRYIKRCVENRRLITGRYAGELKYLNPSHRIAVKRQEIDGLLDDMRTAMFGALDRRRSELAIKCERLEGLSPLNKLGRGYAYVSAESGEPVLSADYVNINDNIEVTLRDGRINAVVSDVVKGAVLNGK